MKPEHISMYNLRIEDGTPFGEKKHMLPLPDEDTECEMYFDGIDFLASHGYHQYEISNFAKPGCESRHNLRYWLSSEYLGFGPAAHSYDGHSRQWNIASIPQYIQGIHEGSPFVEREELDLHTRYNDYLVTTLRTRWGASLNHVDSAFGNTFHNYLLRMSRPHLQRHHLEIEGDTLRLTEKGIFLSDGIISDLLWVEET